MRKTPVAGSTAAARTGAVATKGVLSRIRPIGYDDQDFINVMLYGSGGSGKTTLWSTFPKPILAIICSGGLNSGETRSIDTAENRAVIDQVELQQSTELKELVEGYARLKKYQTFVLDHVSGFCDRVLAEILGMAELPAQKTWGLASQQDYGQMTLQAKEGVKALLGTKANVVIIAQERVFNAHSDDDGRGAELGINPNVGPGTTPSMAGWLNTACDYVAQTYKRGKTVTRKTKLGTEVIEKEVRVPGVDYCLRVGASDVYTTKFRVPGGVKEDVIINPSYEKIAALIKGRS